MSFGATNRTITAYETANGYDNVGQTQHNAAVSSSITVWFERRKQQIINPDKTVTIVDATVEGDFVESFDTDDILTIPNTFLNGNPSERWRVVSRDEGQGITNSNLKRYKLFLQKVR